MSGLLLALVASSTIACGDVDGRCPGDFLFVFGEPASTLEAKALGCGFYRQAIQWRCRAESVEGEAVAQRRRADALDLRLRERPPERAGWSGLEVLTLATFGVAGAAGGALAPVDGTGERAALGAGGALLGLAVGLALVLAFDP